MGNDFDWDDEALAIIPEQGRIAVYLNPNGDLCIREQGDHACEDQWIVVARGNVEKFLQPVFDVMDLERPSAPCSLLVPEPEPAALTGAERQRRYRERNGKRDRVTRSDEIK